MLNIYKYYDEPKSLPLYSYELMYALNLLPLMVQRGDDITEEQLEPVKNIIQRDPELAYTYAKNIIKGEWPEAESTILKEPEYTNNYAIGVRKRRWPEAEPTILQYPTKCVQYAKKILANDPEWTSQKGHENGRWPEAEPTIMKDPYSAYTYAADVIKGRWPEAEDNLKQSTLWWDSYKDFFDIP